MKNSETIEIEKSQGFEMFEKQVCGKAIVRYGREFDNAGCNYFISKLQGENWVVVARPQSGNEMMLIVSRIVTDAILG